MKYAETTDGVVAADGYPLFLSGERPGSRGGAEWPTPRRVQVFIIEDELFVAWDLEASMLEMGHEVCGIASTAHDAVRSAVAAEPDLLLADINLGGGPDGIEAAKLILSEHRAAVIFVTAYNDAETRARAGDAVPGSIVIGKPVSERELKAAIERLLSPRA